MAEKFYLKHLKDSPDAVALRAGQLIFTQGEEGGHMFVIQEGSVEIRHNDQLVATLTVGDIFGEMALLDHYPRSTTATTKSPCKLVPMNRERFHEMLQQTPQFATEVMQVMADRIRLMLENVSECNPLERKRPAQ